VAELDAFKFPSERVEDVQSGLRTETLDVGESLDCVTVLLFVKSKPLPLASSPRSLPDEAKFKYQPFVPKVKPETSIGFQTP